MKNLYYFIAVILLLIWAIGFFFYNAGGMIHFVLVFAIVAALLRVSRVDTVR